MYLETGGGVGRSEWWSANQAHEPKLTSCLSGQPMD